MAEPAKKAEFWEQESEFDLDDPNSPALKFFKIRPGVDVPQDPPKFKVHLYAPLIDGDSDTSPLLFLNVKQWSKLRWRATFMSEEEWKKLQPTLQPVVKDWSNVPKDCTVPVRGYPLTGPEINYLVQVPQQPKGASYFDILFASSQRAVKRKEIGSNWGVFNDQAWCTGEGKERKDGIAFVKDPQATFVRPPDDRCSQYVLVTTADSSDKDSPALSLYKRRIKSVPSVDKNYIYIPRLTIDQLRGALDADGEQMEYNWAANYDSVCFRGQNGEIQYSYIDPTSIQNNVCRTPEYWQEVYERSTGDFARRGIRSCNPENLEPLVFVLPPSKSGKEDVDALQGFITKTLDQAKAAGRGGGEIHTKAVAYPSTWVNEDANAKKDYMLLNTSPFGEYDTWIAKSDYKAYLRCYAGYKLPTDSTLLTKIKAEFLPKAPKADPVGQSRPPLPAKSAAERGMAERRDAAVGAGTKKDNVGLYTINAARGQRTSCKSQATVMGRLSATDIAKILTWQNERGNDSKTSKVTAMTDVPSRINWPNPGTSVAEWLHRTAFSWGNDRAPEFNQIPRNLVFGSSEANSLMTSRPSPRRTRSCRRRRTRSTTSRPAGPRRWPQTRPGPRWSPFGMPR
ncbi:hypothetical protein B0T22DRAFT_281140 [Podospora appendiculata]|uniref:Uncharacterized protein n=1 Tax=Podospora appendiculata TaxID=314037 RepID=A0AAE1C826_9PEZI|nr:hypothetical protein B0T22DRAFT_281140 [Podospora appendiculata]